MRYYNYRENTDNLYEDNLPVGEFERLRIELSAYLARSPEEQAYEKGYRDGKTKARSEILQIGIGLAVGWILLRLIRAIFWGGM